jgi:lipopolysaccharide/colanic/teichoic acid biosynthesis glycosyltransferase
VNGRSAITDFDQIVRLDLQYIDNWSLWLDIKLLLKTIWVVLARRGAF